MNADDPEKPALIQDQVVSPLASFNLKSRKLIYMDRMIGPETDFDNHPRTQAVSEYFTGNWACRLYENCRAKLGVYTESSPPQLQLPHNPIYVCAVVPFKKPLPCE